MTAEDPLQPEEKPAKKERLESLDAFRGFTILGMVFVIAIAAGQYWQEIENPLPQTMSWFGSNPVSTWFHSDVGFEIYTYTLEEQGIPPEQFEQTKEYQQAYRIRQIGVTFTDLIAPWFVFIVGACIPLSRSRRGGDWWRHVGWRTFMLIFAGVIYIALVIKQLTWWWGVLQAIGVAYFMGAVLCKFPKGPPRWIIILAVAGFHLLMSSTTHWWTGAFEDIDAPFMTLTNPNGSALRPLLVHCQPWLSIGYGIMTMIGVLVGESLVTKDPQQIRNKCLLVGGSFVAIGYVIHQMGFILGRLELCMSKADVTTSYAFFTAGLGALCFLGFYWVMDVMKYKKWAWPLTVYGANPLLAYFTMIIMRRGFESLGVIDAFNRVPGNEFVHNWAIFFGSEDSPAMWVYAFFAKGGYMGVFWGLVWCFLLWLIVLYFNKRNLYWKF